MLGLPKNAQILPLGGGLFFGKVNKMCGSVEFSSGWKNIQGKFDTLQNMRVQLNHFRYGANFWYNLRFKPPYAVYAGAGGWMSQMKVVSKDLSFGAADTITVFENATIKQNIMLFAGAMVTFFKETYSGDYGAAIKMGYYYPVGDAVWMAGSTKLAEKPKVSMGGPGITLYLYSWSYRQKYLKNKWAMDLKKGEGEGEEKKE
jgi:hypothetical protein